MKFSNTVNQVIDQHLTQLRKPGVLSIRSGYEATGGWLTQKPAIVVTVEQKRDDLPPDQRLPETLGGFPVDVRQAGARQRLRATNVSAFATAAVFGRPELARPVFADERDPNGPGVEGSSQITALQTAKKPALNYTPPADASLDAVEDEMTIVCHASPDAGWPTLKEFLQATHEELIVGMYDFTSAHILQTFESVLAGKQLSMVLDHPAPNPSRDQTDEDTVTDLKGQLNGNFKFAWALERQDPKAAEWIYPSAYHIKVIVQDGKSFWQSSGNLNNSNQPDIDPLSNPAGSAAIARKSDRDWHVIVKHAGLATTFKKFLLNDLAVAAAHQAAPHNALVALSASLDGASTEEQRMLARTPKQYFPPHPVSGRIKLQPLLTPDNYCQQIQPLIASAKKSVYMQTQYIHPSDDSNLTSLIDTVAEQIKNGLDVRLILSQYETMDWLEQLQAADVELSTVRIQTGVHNKGIVIDHEVAVVSSQNWSGAGVTNNRDAGVIIYNAEAAQYFEQIFIHDWTKMAVQHAAD